MVRNAVSMNVATDKIVSTAKFMAHTGINIKFVPDNAFNAENINALYKQSQNTIYINATKGDSNKTFDQLIVHETAHALYKVPKYRKLMKKLAKKLDKKTQEEVESLYGTTIKRQAFTSKEDVLKDEFAAHYLEYALGKEGMLESLLKEDVSLVEALRNHIKKGEKLFGGDERLDAASKRVYKKFKKALANFSESNKGFNAYKGDKGGESRYAQEKVKIRNTVKNAIENKGKLNTEFNQVQISKIPDDVRDMISLCSDNKIDLVDKNIAINGDYIWHEYRRHSNKNIEDGFQQIPLTPQRMSNAIFSIYNPDIIECVFATSDNPKQRQSFAYAKKVNDGYYVVIEAVGGKRNPNVTPIMVLIFIKSKWKKMMSQGLTLGEILYSKDAKIKNLLDVNFNKKNRVIAAQLDSKKPTATTPHSPRFNNSILQPSEKINPSDENSSKNISADIRRQSVSKVGGATNQASKRTYSYNELVAKGNLTGVVIDKSQQVKIKTAPDGTVKIDDAYIQSEVRKQCEVLHKEKGNPVYYVKVSDIGENVEITSKGVRHGYHKSLKAGLNSISNRDSLNARISLELPEILQKSIEVNISNRTDNSDILYSHIMMGTVGIELAQGNIEYYAVRSVIEERANQNPVLSEYQVVGKLHAINAKKISGSTAQKVVTNNSPKQKSTYMYRIPQFLDDVKGVFDDTFSNDVYIALNNIVRIQHIR